MFLGHLPAGYLLTRGSLRAGLVRPSPQLSRSSIITLGLVGAVLPDFDLLYFYLIDDRQHLHHGYWTHIPSFWVAVFAVIFILAAVRGSVRLRTAALVLSVGVFGHLLLDTVVGKIRWLAPLSGRDFVLFDVPARYSWWVWNFVLHWTFAFELVLVVTAVAVLWRERRSAS